MASNKFASGKYSWGVCDICGVRCRYSEMKTPTIRGKPTGKRVCPDCYDPDHPQNFLSQYVSVDAQALRDARPDTGLAASRILYPNANWPPFPSPATRRMQFREEDK
jgi:hypothetical protein